MKNGKVKITAIFVAPLMFIANTSLSLSIMQTSNPIINFLRPAMPFITNFLGFFGNLLIPLGEFFGTLLQGPLTALGQAIPPRSATGYALYIIIFAAIIIVALYLNVIWRPLGYATSDSRAKREAKEVKEAEREAAKEKAKAERKASKRKPAEKIEATVPDKAGSGEPSAEKAPDTTKESPVPSPPIKVVTEKDIEKAEQVDKKGDDGAVGAKADEKGDKKD
nr:hypothetical protein [Candidatus Sigynarchaeum springense]